MASLPTAQQSTEENTVADDIKILVMDDEKEITDLIEIYLKEEGYQVIKKHNGAGILETIESEGVVLAILDIMMPGEDGITICRNIREKMNIPIIMVTAKSNDVDKITGLVSGADDYITKPFKPLELIARVKSQLRRYINLNPQTAQANADKQIEIAGLLIDKSEHSVMLYDNPVELTPMEFDILYLLATNPNKVFSAQDIFCEVWKEKFFENSNNTVMVHIRHIREKLNDSGKNPRFIKTVWGVGYKMEK